MTEPWQWTRRASRLAQHLPVRTYGAVLGDLLEEYTTLRATKGRWRAEWWLAGEMSSLRRAYRRQAAMSGARGRRVWHVQPSDLTHAWRSLRRAPSYAMTLAAVVAVSLALATTVFAVVDGALFKPLPYRQPDRLFVVTMGHRQVPEPLRAFPPISPAEFHDWAPVLADGRLTAFYSGDLQVVGVHDFVRSARIDPAFFDVMGLRPALGGFAPNDFLAMGPIVPALVTWTFWQTRFGGDPAAIGRSLVDDTGQGVRIAGVLPQDFVFPFPSTAPELLTPLVDTTPRSRGATLRILARRIPDDRKHSRHARLSRSRGPHTS